MPQSANQEITVAEAEKRLGIQPDSDPKEELSSTTDSIMARHTAVQQTGLHDGMQERLQDDLPASLRNRKPRELTISKTFRLPLGLVTQLERVSSIHDLPMVTILAEALEIHLARFPR